MKICQQNVQLIIHFFQCWKKASGDTHGGAVVVVVGVQRCHPLVLQGVLQQCQGRFCNTAIDPTVKHSAKLTGKHIWWGDCFISVLFCFRFYIARFESIVTFSLWSCFSYRWLYFVTFSRWVLSKTHLTFFVRCKNVEVKVKIPAVLYNTVFVAEQNAAGTVYTHTQTFVTTHANLCDNAGNSTHGYFRKWFHPTPFTPTWQTRSHCAAVLQTACPT